METDPPFFATAWFWLLFALAVIVIAVRLALSPLATAIVRLALKLVPGYAGSVDHVSISLLPLRVRLEDLTLTPEAKSLAEPFLHVACVEAGAALLQLVRGKLALHARIIQPRVVLTNAQALAPRQQDGAHAEEAPKKTPTPSEWLAKITPFRVDRFELRQGEIAFVDETAAPAPEVRLSELELTIDNLANRNELQQNAPAALMMRARVQNTGNLSLMANAEPLAPLPTFSGHAELTGLRLRDVAALAEAKAGLSPEGVFECFVTFTALNGRLSGAIKPVLKDPSIAGAGGVGSAVAAKIADATVSALAVESQQDAHDTVATTLPIRGTLVSPSAQVWPMVLGLVRNAFVEGVRSGFANLPQTAATKQSLGQQLADTFNPKSGGPKAQPPTTQRRD